jgi:hypothetical protein
MRYKRFSGLSRGALLALSAALVASCAGRDALAPVREATAEFRDVEVAQAKGWTLVPGLDHCFENPGVGAMGFHYINGDLMDTSLDPLTPEAMVYAAGPNGQLELGAVEYIVPAEAWEEAGSDQPPQVLGQDPHLNEKLGVYVLHAWIFRTNPSGVFQDWNPEVSCGTG